MRVHNAHATPLTNLPENGAQLVEVRRFGKVKVEAGFFASEKIFLLPEPGQGNCGHGLLFFRMGHEFIAAPIWKAYVGEHNIEELRIASLQG